MSGFGCVLIKVYKNIVCALRITTELEMNNYVNNQNIWRLYYTLLNNHVTEETANNIKEYFELNENDYTRFLNVWALKQCLGWNLVWILISKKKKGLKLIGWLQP